MNSLFFTELTQRIIRTASQMSPMGRLYAVDMRLRPTGKSGSLVLPLAEFRRYFQGSMCQLWERQSLGRARAVRGDSAFTAEVKTALREAMLGQSWRPPLIEEIRQMRAKLEATTSARNLKRGPGGMVDVEFIVQLLQLKYGGEHPDLVQSNIWDALDAFERRGLLSTHDAAGLRNGYSFLRLVEARLRIVTDRPLTEVPEHADDRAKLARRLGFDSPSLFLMEMKRVTADLRKRYESITTRERN